MGRLAMAFAARNRTAYFHVADIAQALADDTLTAGRPPISANSSTAFFGPFPNCDLDARVALVELKLN
jgi:hypothetical protein